MPYELKVQVLKFCCSAGMEVTVKLQTVVTGYRQSHSSYVEVRYTVKFKLRFRVSDTFASRYSTAITLKYVTQLQLRYRKLRYSYFCVTLQQLRFSSK